MNLKPYAKAIGAAVVALIGGIAVGYADESLKTSETWAAIAAAVTAAGAVFRIPNAPTSEGDL